MTLRVLIACHNAISHGGEFKSSLKGKEITYDFIDTHDYRSTFKQQRIEDTWDTMASEEEVNASIAQPSNPQEYDRIEEEYFGKYPDRKQYRAWKDVPVNTYDYVFGMFCPTQEAIMEGEEEAEEVKEWVFNQLFPVIRAAALGVLKPGGSFIIPLGITNGEHDYNPAATEKAYPTPKGFVRSEVYLGAGTYHPDFPEFWEEREKYPYGTRDRWDVKYTKQVGGRRGRTFRTKPKRRNKNGRRFTHKSSHDDGRNRHPRHSRHSNH